MACVFAVAVTEYCQDVTVCVHRVVNWGQKRLDKHMQYFGYHVPTKKMQFAERNKAMPMK